MCTHNQCFTAKKRKTCIFHLKINIFTAVKYCCILHGRVFVIHVNLDPLEPHSYIINPGYRDIHYFYDLRKRICSAAVSDRQQFQQLILSIK